MYIKSVTDRKTEIYFLKNLSLFFFVVTERNDEIRTHSATRLSSAVTFNLG